MIERKQINVNVKNQMNANRLLEVVEFEMIQTI